MTKSKKIEVSEESHQLLEIAMKKEQYENYDELLSTWYMDHAHMVETWEQNLRQDYPKTVADAVISNPALFRKLRREECSKH